MLNNKPTKKQVNYAWYLMRSSGLYTEEGMVLLVNGATFYSMGRAINTRAHKYPVIERDDKGQSYKFSGSVLDDVMVNMT